MESMNVYTLDISLLTFYNPFKLIRNTGFYLVARNTRTYILTRITLVPHAHIGGDCTQRGRY